MVSKVFLTEQDTRRMCNFTAWSEY